MFSPFYIFSSLRCRTVNLWEGTFSGFLWPFPGRSVEASKPRSSKRADFTREARRSSVEKQTNDSHNSPAACHHQFIISHGRFCVFPTQRHEAPNSNRWITASAKGRKKDCPADASVAQHKTNLTRTRAPCSAARHTLEEEVQKKRSN